jgi:hypothetical protein
VLLLLLLLPQDPLTPFRLGDVGAFTYARDDVTTVREWGHTRTQVGFT